MHTQVAIQLITPTGYGPAFVVIRVLDLTDPEKAEQLSWHRLDDLAEGGHVISAIGHLIKPALVTGLKAAGIIFH